MHTPTGAFNSQVDSDQIWKNSFVTRLYGLHNQRGPYFYPESPYSLGDIVPMSAMAPIDDDTLFATLPAPASVLATSVAPIGSAGFPTFQSSAPGNPGTILGPAGATVPSFVSQTPASWTSPYGAGGSQSGSPAIVSAPGTPAATLDQVTQSSPAGPITYTNPWPTMIAPPASDAPAASPSIMCEFGDWVNANPGLAFLGTVGVYFLLRGKKRR
jgi:hypothetical protein